MIILLSIMEDIILLVLHPYIRFIKDCMHDI